MILIKMLKQTLIMMLICTGILSAQGRFDNVEIKTTHVRGNIYMLEGKGGNIGVCAGEDGILIIDDQFAELADKIKAALKEINPGELKFLLNTHVHGDHIGGNSIFGKVATIIAHDNIRNRMIDKFKEDSTAQGKNGWPVITFDKSLTVHFNNETIEVMHFPKGHTDGDAVIYFKDANIVHMGDHMFSGLFPYIDINSGGSVDGYIKNVDAVLAQVNDSTMIIPGHGPLSTKKELTVFSHMLHKTTKLIRDMKSSGMTSDEIAAEGLGDEWKSFDWGFIPTERWIETIYSSTK
ncbi:MAG: MBL fold metallo-hydrolase [Calditrichaeota bacterium]|nr:MAG: MBL fold metallo-hydrolase [Calditrichota bacterium]